MANAFILYLTKTPENERFSRVCRDRKIGTLARNWWRSFRSTHQRCSIKKGALQNPINLTY